MWALRGMRLAPKPEILKLTLLNPQILWSRDLKVKKKPKEQHMYICTYILSLHIKGIALYVTVTSSAIRAPNKYKGSTV